MAETLPETFIPEELDISHIVTEDDTPVDNIFSEKQQRLLTESLNSNWNPGKTFIACSNVGIFYAIHQPPIVPDMFLSMDVKVKEDMWEKKNRSYFLWEFGKPPEMVVEVVSNKKGGELEKKLGLYQQIRILYYIVFDPRKLVQKEDLRIYEFSAKGYIPKIGGNLTEIGLSVKLWDGIYEGTKSTWLRWYDNKGELILTGAEQSEKLRQRAEQAEKKLEAANKETYNKARETARKMLEKGYEPDEIYELTGVPVKEIQS